MLRANTGELIAMISVLTGVRPGHAAYPKRPDCALFRTPSESDYKYMMEQDGKSGMSLYEQIIEYAGKIINIRMMDMGLRHVGEAIISSKKIVPVYSDSKGRVFSLQIKNGYICARHVSKKFQIIVRGQDEKSEDDNNNRLQVV